MNTRVRPIQACFASPTGTLQKGSISGQRSPRLAAGFFTVVGLVRVGGGLPRPSPAVPALRLGAPVPGVEPIGVGPDGRLTRDPERSRTSNVSSRYECDADRLMLASMDNEQYFRDILDVALLDRGQPSADGCTPAVHPVRGCQGSRT